MTDDIQSLIDSLRRGQYEDPTEKIALLSAALQEHQADLELLLSLLRAPQIPLRLAALDAAQNRKEPALLAEFARLADDPETRVRVKVAEILRLNTNKEAGKILTELAHDIETEVRSAALKSTAGRPEFRMLQEAALADDTDWNVRLTAANALESQNTPKVVTALFKALEQDDDNDVRKRCAEILEKRLLHFPEATKKSLPSEIARVTKAERNVKQLGAERVPNLVAWLASQTTVVVDPASLTPYGTDLTALAEAGTLPRAHYVERGLETLLKLVQREPWRPIALIGAAGVGKSALVNELVYELAKPENGAWRVLRVSPTDFMAGTKYLGEWETKLRDLIQTIRKPRRVLLYVPNLSELTSAGISSRSDTNVATALGPYLEDGSIFLLGESGPDEYERGLGKVPSVRRLFDTVLMHEPGIERTRNILIAIRDEEESTLSNETLDQLLELSGQFLSHLARPGNAVELLRSVIKNEKEAQRPLTFRDVLDALTKSTGIPPDLLDDGVPLNGGEVREFFEKKVIGQADAVDAVIDLVTLIKAGVTDPNKPFGVFLFVGPTGVGKTELARALAEFIFGDVARLKRFDMSEFASPEGFTRLIGTTFENGLLTDAVRQHPFSVVLLDEIEKSHINVFDLCLQIFDAGRLTDGRGRTVDFRRTIVILTSNIGATASTNPLGFGGDGAAPAAGSGKKKTFRELSRVFRPEFLNRIDRIIHFRPLSLQVAEQIARREIDAVLQRSGIRRRQLMVDVDPEVVSLVVREGYSPHFGARPLKRTVERLLLLPLARAISSGSLRGGTVLRLTERNGRLQAVMTAPPVPKPVTAAKAPVGDLTELHRRYTEVEAATRPLADRKSELIARTQEKDFFRDEDLRTATFTEIHNLDAFLHLQQEVGKAIASVKTLTKENLSQLESDIAYLSFVARCKDARDLGDAVITISLIDRTGTDQRSIEKFAEMYRGLADRRRMTAEVVGEFYNEKHDRVYMLVSGLAAYGLLKDEAGLHQVDHRFKERAARSSREVVREHRELLRVETYAAANKPSKQFMQQVKIRVSPLKPPRKRLLKADLSLSLFHEPSVRSVEFWTAGPKEDAVERGLAVLSAQAASSNLTAADTSLVRQYDLGISPKVKDVRTGRTTTRVKQVLKGELGSLMSFEGGD